MDTVSIFLFSGTCEGMLMINGLPYGRVGSGARRSVPVEGTCQLLVQFFPTDDRHLPLTRVIDITDGQPAVPQEGNGMEFTRWPGGRWDIMLSPPLIPPSADYPLIPEVLHHCLITSPSGSAQLVRFGQLWLCIEDETSAPVFTAPLGCCMAAPSMEAVQLLSGEIILITLPLRQGQQVFTCRFSSGRWQFADHGPCDEISVDHDTIILTRQLEDDARHVRSIIISPTSDTRTEYSARQHPLSPQDTVMCFLKAISLSLYDEAHSYLCHDLRRQFSPQDMTGFFPDFERTELMAGQTPGRITAALLVRTSPALLTAHPYEFTLQDGFIYDINAL